MYSIGKIDNFMQIRFKKKLVKNRTHYVVCITVRKKIIMEIWATEQNIYE